MFRHRACRFLPDTNRGPHRVDDRCRCTATLFVNNALNKDAHRDQPAADDAISLTRANTTGSTLQISSTAPAAGHGNHFVAGVSVDHAATHFVADSQLGAFNAGRYDIPAPGDLEVMRCVL
jgi:hypothetical protein